MEGVTSVCRPRGARGLLLARSRNSRAGQRLCRRYAARVDFPLCPRGLRPGLRSQPPLRGLFVPACDSFSHRKFSGRVLTQTLTPTAQTNGTLRAAGVGWWKTIDPTLSQQTRKDGAPPGLRLCRPLAAGSNRSCASGPRGFRVGLCENLCRRYAARVDFPLCPRGLRSGLRSQPPLRGLFVPACDSFSHRKFSGRVLTQTLTPTAQTNGTLRAAGVGWWKTIDPILSQQTRKDGAPTCSVMRT